MKEDERTGYGERLKTAAAARQALVDRLKPKPSIKDPLFDERLAIEATARADAQKALRQARADAKAAKAQAMLDAQQNAADALKAQEEADTEAKRGQRKERKALSKVEAKAKRDARYAARKAR